MCGLSTSINEMIVWRAIQGFIGGGMIPTVFASAYMIFPRSRMGLIVPLIGLIATLAPTIGPTIGGYLTDTLSWHWLFFINIVPGIFVTVAALTLIDFDKPDYRLFDRFDWLGLLSMAGFLGGLEYVLEEGPRNDWFGDDSVLLLRLGLGALGHRLLRPRAHGQSADRRFAGVLGSQFRARLAVLLRARHRSLWPHLSLSALSRRDPRLRRAHDRRDGVRLGLAMFLTAPIAGRLMNKVDPRFMLAAGFLSFAVGSWWMTYLTSDWDFWELVWPQIFRGVGLMTAMIPINNVALGTLPPSG